MSVVELVRTGVYGGVFHRVKKAVDVAVGRANDTSVHETVWGVRSRVFSVMSDGVDWQIREAMGNE